MSLPNAEDEKEWSLSSFAVAFWDLGRLFVPLK
jgi:hypothetical protein